MSKSNEQKEIPENLIPKDINAEEAILGSIFVDPGVYFSASQIVSSDDFFVIRNGWVFSAMGDLIADGKPIDYLTVSGLLEQRQQLVECGGIARLLSLINKTPYAYNIEGYARSVWEMSARRRLAAAAGRIVNFAYKDMLSIDEIFSQSHIELRQATASHTEAKRIHIGKIHDLQEDEEDSNQLLTDWQEIDEVMDYRIGFGKLFSIQAASGQFKSTLAGQMVSSWALMGHPVVYVTMEDWPEEIKGQIVRYQAFIHKCTLSDARKRIDASPFEIVSKRQSVDAIKNIVLSTGYPRGIVVVDTLQKLTDCIGRNGVETGAVAGAMASLDGAKLDTGWLWIVLVQQYMETNTTDPIKLRPSRNNVKDSKAVFEASDLMLGGYWADDWRHEFGQGFLDDKCPEGMYMVRGMKVRRGNKRRKKYDLLKVIDGVPALVSPDFVKPPVQQTFVAATSGDGAR